MDAELHSTIAMRQLASACAVLLMACGGQETSGVDAGSESAPSPLGSYTVRSDVRIDVPAEVTAIADAFEAAALDAPSWLCNATAARVPDAELATALQAGCDGFVRRSIDDHILLIAPDLAVALLSLSDDVPALVKSFGVRSELRIELVARDLVGNHRVHEILFGDRAIPLLDFGIGVNIETDIGISWYAPSLGIAGHEVGIWLGTVGRMALDRVALPPYGASDMHGLYTVLVDCTVLGETIFDALGRGSAPLYKSACMAAMTDAASAVYSQLEALDRKVPRLYVTSTAEGLDSDGDGSVDRISGRWDGMLREEGTAPGPLSANFVATRL